MEELIKEYQDMKDEIARLRKQLCDNNLHNFMPHMTLITGMEWWYDWCKKSDPTRNN